MLKWQKKVSKLQIETTIIIQRHTLFEFHNRNLDFQAMQISPLGSTKSGVTSVVWIGSHHNRSKIQVWCTTICTTCLAKTLNRSCCPHPHDRAQKRNSNHAIQRNSIWSGFSFTSKVIFTPFTMLADQNHFNMSPANFRMSPSLVLRNNV